MHVCSDGTTELDTRTVQQRRISNYCDPVLNATHSIPWNNCKQGEKRRISRAVKRHNNVATGKPGASQTGRPVRLIDSTSSESQKNRASRNTPRTIQTRIRSFYSLQLHACSSSSGVTCCTVPFGEHVSNFSATLEIMQSLIRLGYLLWKGTRFYKIKQGFVDLLTYTNVSKD